MVITYVTPRAIGSSFNTPARIGIHHEDGKAHFLDFDHGHFGFIHVDHHIDGPYKIRTLVNVALQSGEYVAEDTESVCALRLLGWEGAQREASTHNSRL